MTASRTPDPLLAPIVVLALVTAATIARAEGSPDAGALLEQARASYENRHKGTNAKRAVDLFEKAISASPTYEALWEGARAAAYLGDSRMTKAPRHDRTAVFQKGEAWARQAVKLRPDHVAGHFYIAVLIGMRAQSQSIFHQMGVAREIRERAERSVKLDPGFECAGPLRMLGQYYLRLPEAFGGSNAKAHKLLERGMKACPSDLSNRVDLAEALHALDKNAAAREQLRYVLSHPPTDPEDLEGYPDLKLRTQEFLDDWE
jgi:tetratricopeptide (TPR) repeat protein